MVKTANPKEIMVEIQYIIWRFLSDIFVRDGSTSILISRLERAANPAPSQTIKIIRYRHSSSLHGMEPVVILRIITCRNAVKNITMNIPTRITLTTLLSASTNLIYLAIYDTSLGEDPRCGE